MLTGKIYKVALKKFVLLQQHFSSDFHGLVNF